MSSKNSQLQTNQKPWPPAGVDWYYSDDYTAIAHGDCREILPLLPKVHLVLTDPPYGIGWNPRVNHKDSPWKDKERFDSKEASYNYNQCI